MYMYVCMLYIYMHAYICGSLRAGLRRHQDLREEELQIQVLGKFGGLRRAVEERTVTDPRGSKYTVSEVSDPNNHQQHGFWNQKSQLLGTWTFCGLEFFLFPEGA